MSKAKSNQGLIRVLMVLASLIAIAVIVYILCSNTL